MNGFLFTNLNKFNKTNSLQASLCLGNLEIMVESREDFLAQMLPLCHNWANHLISLGLYYLIYKMKTISLAFLAFLCGLHNVTFEVDPVN